VNRDNVITFQGPIEYKRLCAGKKITEDGPFIGCAAGGEACSWDEILANGQIGLHRVARVVHKCHTVILIEAWRT
jgi:hypothetical protein